jgi:hypothetical protein
MNPKSFFHVNRHPKENTPAHSMFLRVLKWFLPNGGTILIALLLIFTQKIWAQGGDALSSAVGPAATTVNYQGRLAKPDGTPVTNGNYAMSFAIFNAATGGNLIWPAVGPETYTNIPVSGGLFSVGLGSQTPGGIPTSVWNGDRYLEIAINGETLSPRELIRSVPIAGMALTVPDSSITTEKIAEGAITSEKLKATTGFIQVTDTQVVQTGSSWSRKTIPQSSSSIALTSDSKVLLWFSSSAFAPASITRYTDLILIVDGGISYVSSATLDGQNPLVNYSGVVVLYLKKGVHDISLQIQSGLENDSISFIGNRTNIVYLVMKP